MLVSAILSVMICTSNGCESGVVAKFSQGEAGQMICTELARQLNRAGGDEPGYHSTYTCKRTHEGTRG